MPDDAAFLAAIREQPLDDLRRLVYADWLDEQGRSAEAEYLRLVAALAEPGTPVDVTHPHAVRLLALADGIDHTWREAVGGRFDLWFDGYEATLGVEFIRSAVAAVGQTVPDARRFRESLPRVLSGAIPLEEAKRRGRRFHEFTRQRIMPATEVPSAGLLRGGVALYWLAEYQDPEFITTPEQTRAALGHLRRILEADTEFAPLAATVPQETDEKWEYTVILAPCVPLGESKKYKQRLLGGRTLYGDNATPPFSGHINVGTDWRPSGTEA